MQATAQFAQGRIEDAVELYRRAVAAPGADAAMFLGYGNALFAAGDAVEAAKQFARAVELDPQNARARFSLAMSHLRPVYDDAAQMEASRRAFSRALADSTPGSRPHGRRRRAGPSAAPSPSISPTTRSTPSRCCRRTARRPRA